MILSQSNKFFAIIPARYASTRFPGKPLAMLGDKPVIEHVWNRVSALFGENVAVATDDKRIASCVKGFGGKAVMTSPDHRSGTDRCREAVELLGVTDNVIFNIQGDEPFIDIDSLESLMHCFDMEDVDIATLVRPLPPTTPYSTIADPSLVKVVVSNGNRAMYFSRSPIPYCRGVEAEQWTQTTPYYGHIGVYAYRHDVLRRLSSLPQSQLECAESLEQLRWLQNGYSIAVAYTNAQTIGIDTPEDLDAAKKYLDGHHTAD